MSSAGPARAIARLTMRSDARELRHLRLSLRDFLGEEHRIDRELCDDLILVTNELATNAIEAAALGTDVTALLGLLSRDSRW